MKNKKGFTLVEMLVVIAIIAILSSIFLVGLGGFRKQAYDTRRISDVQKIQTFLELYYNQNRAYPADLGLLAGLGTIPTDPISKLDYKYCTDGSTAPQSYVINATLDQASSVLGDSGEIDDSSSVCGTGAIDCLDANKQYCVGPGSSN